LPPPADAEIRSIIDDVIAVRGGRWKTIPLVKFLDREPFLAAFRSHQTHMVDKFVHLAVPFLVAFWSSPSGQMTSGQLKSSLAGAMDEQVVGFYDEQSQQLYVRTDLPHVAGGSEEAVRTMVIAHEVGHAWQDQNVGLRGLLEPTTLDEMLALLATIEGDASVTAALVIARRRGVDLDEAIAEHRRIFRMMGPEELIALTASSPKLLALPQLLRELMTFPYLSGDRFSADLYATGGSPLMLQVLSHPPRTTLAILEPQRFLDGATPPPTGGPPPTPLAGTAGAELLWTVLSPCTGAPKAKALAREWHGDRFVLSDGVRLSWAVELQREDSARLLMEALQQFPSCSKRDPQLRVEVRAHGPLVLYAEGKDAAALPAAVDALEKAGLAGIAPGKPPFGKQTIPSPDRLGRRALAHRGTVTGSAYASPHLGLSATVPAKALVRVDLPESDLALARGGSDGFVSTLRFNPVPVSTEQLQILERAMLLGMQRQGGKPEDLHELAAGEVDLGWAQGQRKEWVVKGDRHIRMLVLGACAGRGTLLVTQVWSTPEAGEAMEAFLGSFRITDPSPPACRLLH